MKRNITDINRDLDDKQRNDIIYKKHIIENIFNRKERKDAIK